MWSEYTHLLSDPAHWLFELTLILVVDVLIGAMLFPFARRWLQRHDREKHGTENIHYDEAWEDE